MKQNYVLGFMFSPRHDFVVLICKKKPKWQAGLLNGIGGKIEGTWWDRLLGCSETPRQALVREFDEETGFLTAEAEWRPFCTLKGAFGSVQCFAAVSSTAGFMVRTRTDETVLNVNSETFGHYPVVDNVPVLVDLAKHRLLGHSGQVTIKYTNYKS